MLSRAAASGAALQGEKDTCGQPKGTKLEGRQISLWTLTDPHH